MNRKNIIFLLATIFSTGIMFGMSDAECLMGTYSVDISYEPSEADLPDFFKNQLTKDVFDGFLKCNAKFNLHPCYTSNIVNGKLTCKGGEDECALDRMFACATELNKNDMVSVGRFVIAMFNTGNKICSAQNLATSNGLKNWDAIDKCSKSPEADNYCQTYHDLMKGHETSHQNESDASKDFKGYICKDIKKHNLCCSFCDGVSGVPGNGGGSNGGGGHSGGGANGGGGSNGSGGHSGGGANGGGGSNGGGGQNGNGMYGH